VAPEEDVDNVCQIAMTSNDFSIFAWSAQIPLCDDLYLGMQARNVAMVDLAVIRDIESQALSAYMERERTPVDILMPLSALSQMWVFSLYEFLRTWRQRAEQIIRVGDEYHQMAEADRANYLEKALSATKGKQKFVKLAPSFQAEQMARVVDAKFLQEVKDYRDHTEELFRNAESLRVTIAKHEIPKTNGMFAEAPGYGRMSYTDGSIYWFVTYKDDSQLSVNRRELADTFLEIDSQPI